VLDEAAVADKEATNKRAAVRQAAEEATAKRAVEEAAEEATVKAEAAEVAGAARGSSAPGQAPPAAGAKMATTPSGSTPPAKCSYRGVWKPRFVQHSLPLFSLFLWLHSLTTVFAHVLSLRHGRVMGAAITDAVVGEAPGLAHVSEPWTPEGVPEDIVESEGEPEVAPEAVPEMVQEEAPVEGAMIAVLMVAAPMPSRGAHAPLLSAPRRAVASGAATGKGMEVVLGHPTPYASGDISVSEAMSTAHQALSQAQHVLHCEGEDLADELHHLQLWASMLKRMTMSERVAAWAR
jgi:hypothetical protein